MRKMILIIALLMICLGLLAQEMNEMVILKQAERRTDQIIDQSHKDASHRICAGILIITDLDGLTFQSNIGVVGMDYNPGRYMVFVSEGERVLDIYKTGFKPLEIILSEYGIYGLKSGQVYQLEVTSKNKEADKMQSVIFNVTPPDASIKVGSQTYISGQAQSLPIGKNEVVIEKEGYRSVKDTIEVSKSIIQFNYILTQIDVVLVKFKSIPTEANLIVNNISKGKTNKDLFLYPGRYDVKMNKDNYLDINESILVSETGENNISFNLTKNSGFINIDVQPDIAKVFINNEPVENYQSVELPPGQYKIEAKADAYDSFSEIVEVKLGETIQKNFNLSPRYGNLLLSVNPPETDIEISKNNIKIKSFIGSQIVKDLLEGEYQISAKVKGFKTFTTNIRINKQKREELNIEMEKGSDVPDNFVLVEGGTFLMGSTTTKGDPIERPFHSVTVSSFYIGIYEVTQKDWQAVMDSNPSKFSGERKPVEQVTWFQAVEFCNKLSQNEGLTPCYSINGENVTCDFTKDGYRLPTEAEWEFAARGGNKSLGFKYSGSNERNDVGWIDSNSKGMTHPVGQKLANELGFYDMSGNVYEWCNDGYEKHLPYDRENPIGGGSDKIYKGGCWYYGMDSRVTWRDSHSALYCDKYIGFRVARSFL